MTRMARQRSAHCRRVRQEKPRETKDLQSFGKEIKDSRELKKKKVSLQSSLGWCLRLMVCDAITSRVDALRT